MKVRECDSFFDSFPPVGAPVAGRAAAERTHTAMLPHAPACRVNGRLASLDVSQPALQPLLMPGLELARTGGWCLGSAVGGSGGCAALHAPRCLHAGQRCEPAVCPTCPAVLEHDLGQPLADANFFAELQGRKPAERLFVCIPGD